MQLKTSERRRLTLARENGYLHSGSQNPAKLLAVYSRWCWRLRVPIVWSERRSPHSRYGRVSLDLYPTPNRLTAFAQTEMRTLAGAATVSPHDACWDWVPLCDLDRLSGAVLRAATRPANYEVNPLAKSPKIRFIDRPLSASA